MIEILLALVPALAPLPPEDGQGPLAARGAPTAEEELDREYDAAIKDYKKAALDWRRAQRKARKEGVAFSDAYPAAAYFPRFEALAAKGEIRAVLWTALNVQELELERDAIVARKRAAFGRIVADELDEATLKEVLRRLPRETAYLEPGERAAFFVTLHGGLEGGEQRALAGFLAGQAYEQSATDAGFEEAERWYEATARVHPDTKSGKRAKTRLSAMNVAVGRAAPDFDAKDVDGAEFKLSDYRGKVVVLDFWGFW